MNNTLDNPLRKVAILVACLDEDWSEQILAQLPPTQAEQVRRLVRHLVDIDPAEQQEVVAEFRRSLAPAASTVPASGNTNGVELDYSLQARISEADYPQQITRRRSPLESISTADSSFIVEMLTQEHPQTIALVVSRLEPAQAAEVLGRFDPDVQADILGRLANLDSTDQETVAVVEAQVGKWIAEQRQRKQRLAAGLELVEQILHQTPAEKREGIFARVDRTNPLLSSRLQRQPALTQEPQSAAAPTRPRPRPIPLGRPRAVQELSQTPTTPKQPPRPANPFSSLTTEECQQSLEKLDDDSVLRGLARCETRVATLALLGASEKVLKRILARLPRQAARGLRQALRDVGPTRLSDILTAQQQVLLAAIEVGQSGFTV
jgi:flagellar motor switch protein FliG